MRTVGLLGGMSWRSTVVYYRLINEIVEKRLGGLHSAPLLLSSVDFHEITHLQKTSRWAEAGDLLAAAASSLERAGAAAVVVCTNTMHLVANQIQSAIGVPLIDIVDVTAHEIKATGTRRVGLLGTRFTMEEDFYKGRLQRIHSIDAVVPDAGDRAEVSRIIFNELCRRQLHPLGSRDSCTPARWLSPGRRDRSASGR